MSVESLDSILSPGSIVGGSDSHSHNPKSKLYLKDEKPKMTLWQKADKTLENLLKPQDQKPGIANRNLNEKSKPRKIITDISKYGLFFGAQLAFLPSAAVYATLIPAAGLMLGSIADNRKKKQKTTWNRLKPEFYMGNTYGYADYYAFSLPEILMGLTPGLWPAPALSFSLGALPLQLARTAMLESLVLPYNFGYKTFTHFRDHIGLGPTIGGLMTGKIFKYMRDAYKQNIKGKLWKDTVSVWKYLSPLHHFQINHLTSPELRLLESVAVNTPIYRYLMRNKEGEKDAKFSHDSKSKLYKPDGPTGMKQTKPGLYVPEHLDTRKMYYEPKRLVA